MMTQRLLMLFFIVILSCTAQKKVINYNTEISSFRESYKNGFINDPRSPLQKEDLEFLNFYPGDQKWKLVCTCQKAEKALPFELPTYSGATRTYILHTIAKCPFQGKTIELNIYKNITQPINPIYKHHLFLPFKDHTNDVTTYGGGRYINLTENDIKDDVLIIDFNKCYNPWCAYSDGYNCPIPPKENHLEMEVHAGEKLFLGSYKTK